MNGFQALALTVAAAFIGITVSRGIRRGSSRVTTFFWLCLWLAFAAAVTQPEAVAALARLLGIGRGADLVAYLAVVATMAGGFYLYRKTYRLNRHITLLTRELAVRGATRPKPQKAGPRDA